MEIKEYDQVDPFSVAQLNKLALDFFLTPTYVAHIRATDPRPFPEFAVYMVEDGQVWGQVGIFRLPMVGAEGREEVGGLWAVSTHPQHAGKGVASKLLEETHDRMRQAGLRYSTLGTNRWRSAHRLYRQHGYEDMQAWATALAPWEIAHQPTRLYSQPAGSQGYDLIESLYEDIAGDFLGFTWRYKPFRSLRDMVNPEDLFTIWENRQPVGYACVHAEKGCTHISDLLLRTGVDAAEAVASISAVLKADYVQVRISQPRAIASLRAAGYQVAHPSWDSFMIKPLVSGVTVAEARRLFGLGTDRFLISRFDVT